MRGNLYPIPVYVDSHEGSYQSEEGVAKCFAIHPVPMRHQRPHQASADVVQQMQGHFSMGSIQAYRGHRPLLFIVKSLVYQYTNIRWFCPPPIEHEVQC